MGVNCVDAMFRTAALLFCISLLVVVSNVKGSSPYKQEIVDSSSPYKQAIVDSISAECKDFANDDASSNPDGLRGILEKEEIYFPSIYTSVIEHNKFLSCSLKKCVNYSDCKQYTYGYVKALVKKMAGYREVDLHELANAVCQGVKGITPVLDDPGIKLKPGEILRDETIDLMKVFLLEDIPANILAIKPVLACQFIIQNTAEKVDNDRLFTSILREDFLKSEKKNLQFSMDLCFSTFGKENECEVHNSTLRGYLIHKADYVDTKALADDCFLTCTFTVLEVNVPDVLFSDKNPYDEIMEKRSELLGVPLPEKSVKPTEQ